MPKYKKLEELPPDIQNSLKASSLAMHHFYNLSMKQRENVLQNIADLSSKLDKL